MNLLLGVLVLAGVFFAYLSIMRMHEFRQLTANATLANNALMRTQGLANDTAAYNATAKSPELTRILQSVQAKPAAK